METRQDKNDEKQKENEKDQKKTYKENGRFDSHYLNRHYNINLNISSFLTRNLVLFQQRRGNLKMKLGQNSIWQSRQQRPESILNWK